MQACAPHSCGLQFQNRPLRATSNLLGDAVYFGLISTGVRQPAVTGKQPDELTTAFFVQVSRDRPNRGVGKKVLDVELIWHQFINLLMYPDQRE